MEVDEKYIEALIRLHSGLKRQGPGDQAFSLFILQKLPGLPPNPRIADIGCGAGAGALILAKKYGSKVRAVDFSKVFLDQMMNYAGQQGIEDLIEPVECDMGKLDWEPESIDLLWSEGAAYNITFEGALKAWRPLLPVGGIVVISEMNFFTDNAPSSVVEYMKTAYPGIKTESKNVELINLSGFTFLELHRLPSRAWWENYYGPLQENLLQLKCVDDEVMQMVIHETEEEMQFFEKNHKVYGYTFYIMRAI
jgi:cyclopropane fatty-acyl-phospholipid synthase-like methyltransferase